MSEPHNDGIVCIVFAPSLPHPGRLPPSPLAGSRPCWSQELSSHCKGSSASTTCLLTLRFCTDLLAWMRVLLLRKTDTLWSTVFTEAIGGASRTGSMPFDDFAVRARGSCQPFRVTPYFDTRNTACETSMAHPRVPRVNSMQQAGNASLHRKCD
jgi:hypothetical protein